MDKVSDRLEAWAGHPVALLLFVAWCAGMPLINVDVANYAISVVTALLLLLTIGPSRRDRKAVHAKLDDLEQSLEPANSDLARIEERPEHEIEELRR